ncbi:hypothetical protein [Achromobacter xylosoxidans]|uniref:hypothetical protein n=1 Tax=Alcaligenes xylosoxydans xylosoxydans TaxID=85698 RepID=UPI00117895AB|nr:hypothetical protein [Achromobacter xylosoxidans]
MLALLSRHRVFAAYCASLFWLLAACLWFALLTDKGLGHAPAVAAIIGGAIVSYAVFWKLLSIGAPRLTNWPSETHQPPPPLSRTKSLVLLTLALLFAVMFVAHMVTLGKIPILAALSSSNDYGISVIRQEGYFGLPLWLRYLSDYSFKALGPALLVITYLYRQRLFWFVLLVGSLYSLAVFVRILPAIFLTPLLLLLLFQRRWLHLILASALLALLVTIATSASAPGIRSSFVPEEAPAPVVNQADQAAVSGYTSPELPGQEASQEQNVEVVQEPPGQALKEWEIGEPLPLTPPPAPPPVPEKKNWRSESTMYAIFERALFVPGQVIDQWFYFYSRPEAREHGCGYRTFARFIGCEYVPVPSKLYQAFYHENTQRGMQGSLNAVSFMNDYANFGPLGITVSTILTALLFCLITVIYRDHPLALPLNIPLVMVSMETSIITALNSGAGWLAMTALFLYFFRTK